MDENPIIQLPPREMKVKVSIGMKPIPTPIQNDVMRLVTQMRAQGKKDTQIQTFFRKTYKVDLIYV
jgi:hypothetical protein